jgi:hypothetical protein
MEYILINFMLYVRGNFKNVTIDKTTQILLTSPPSGGQGLQNKSFLAGKRGKYRGNNKVAATVPIKTIKYYENTKYTLKKGKQKSAILSCV